MAVRRSDYEDEYGNIDYDAYYSDLEDWADMKYQEWKDDRMMEQIEKEDEDGET